MSDENVTPETNEALEPQHSVGEGQPATDPAEDYKVEQPTEDPHHDDVDVALQEGKETQDGKGEDEVPEADFESYADPSAEKQENDS